jgi:hypothetical protein
LPLAESASSKLQESGKHVLLVLMTGMPDACVFDFDFYAILIAALL